MIRFLVVCIFVFSTHSQAASVWDSTLGKGMIQFITKFNHYQSSLPSRKAKLEAIDLKKKELLTKIQPSFSSDERRKFAAEMAMKFDFDKQKRDLQFEWAKEDAEIANLSKKIIREVASRNNGGTAVAQMYTRAKSLAGQVRSLDDASYSELLDGLTADYVNSPNHRDAIYLLLAGISEELQVDLLSYDDDPVVAYYLSGAAWSWAIVAYFEYRGWKNIKEVGAGAWTDAKVLVRASSNGVKSLTGRLRAVESEAADEAMGLNSQQAQRASFFRSKYEALKASVKQNFSKENFSRKLTDSREALQDYWARRGELTRESMTHLGKSLVSYARQLALAQVGGAVWSLKGWNIRYEPRKVEPLFLLRNIQGPAILELHADTIDLKNTLRKELAPFFPSSGFIQGNADLAAIKAHRAEWMGVAGKTQGLLAKRRADVAALRSQLNHYVHFAPRYLANVPNLNLSNPDQMKNSMVINEMLSFDGWFAPRVRNDELAQAEFLKRARLLNSALNTFEKHIDTVKAAYWNPNKPVKNVSLAPISAQVGTLESWLRIFEERVAELDLINELGKRRNK